MQIVRFLDRLLDWYWTSAVNRETRYRLWEADWTRRVYEARRIAESLFVRQTRSGAHSRFGDHRKQVNRP